MKNDQEVDLHLEQDTPNKGLNVSQFLKILGVALIVLLVCALAASRIQDRAVVHPKPTTAASPQ